MKDPYTILGVKRDATDDEIKSAYRALVRKYHPDNYADDNPLKELATEKMQEINEAYDEIQRLRSGGSSSSSSGGTGYGSTSYGSTGYGGTGYGPYVSIRNSLNSRRFGEAERALMSISEMDRVAEWHYLYSIVLMHKGRVNDAMRELEMACNMDPSNIEYQKAKEMFNTRTRGYGSTYYGGAGRPYRSTTDDACNCCANLICLDCLCECLGGDLIRCI